MLFFAVNGAIFKSDREGEREFPGRIHVSAEHIGNCIAGFAAYEPGLHDSGNFVNPGHCDGIAGNIYVNQFGSHLCKCGNKFVLPVREPKAEPVRSFTILMLCFIETSDKNHIISILRSLHRICEHLFRASRIFAERCPETVLATGGFAHITPFIHHLCICEPRTYAIQRRYFVFCLERRTAPADGHFFNGIFTHHEYLFRILHGQYVSVIFQQHNTFSGDFPGCGGMFRAGEASMAVAFGKIGAELQAKHPAHFFIQLRNVIFPGTKTIQIGSRKMIAVVRIGRTVGETVGPGPEFEVEPVVRGLIGIVASSPVADHNSVESPLPFQYILKQILVVTEMLILIEIVCSHNSPGATIYHSCLERGKINFIESPVIHMNVGHQTVGFVVVESEMLYAGSNALALHPLHVGHHHGSGKIGILTHVFKVAASERMAVDVYAGPEQHRFATVAGFLTYAFAITTGEFWIPACGEAGQRRIGSAGIAGPSGLSPFIPKNFSTDAVRPVCAPDFRNPEAGNAWRTELGLRMYHRHLFFQSNLGEEFVYLLFDIWGLGGASCSKHCHGH